MYMFQDKAVAEKRAKEFIEQVVDTEVVWGLKNAEGWATSTSHQDEEIAILLFWPSSAAAQACATQAWAQYKPGTISLAEFLENWCIGMYHDYCLAGINWDRNMFGMEVEPLELALQILETLAQKGKELSLAQFNHPAELKAQLQQVLEQENG